MLDDEWYFRRPIALRNPVVFYEGQAYEFELSSRGSVGGHGVADGAIVAPMPGRVASVEVAAGEKVAKGQRLLTLEAMKMEHGLVAPFDGTVAELAAECGFTLFEAGQVVRNLIDAQLLGVDQAAGSQAAGLGVGIGLVWALLGALTGEVLAAASFPGGATRVQRLRNLWGIPDDELIGAVAETSGLSRSDATKAVEAEEAAAAAAAAAASSPATAAPAPAPAAKPAAASAAASMYPRSTT